MNNPFVGVINSLLPEPSASLLNGILFGIRANFNRELYQALITTGTLHIIALSGVNITILIKVVARLTLFLGRKLSSLIAIGLIVIFVLFVGPTPSIVRAAMMGSMSLISVYFGRQNWGLLSLTLTASIMLLIDFSLVKNISFQLSFLATLGIILGEKIKIEINKKGFIDQSIYAFKENLRTTLSAQVFTLPIIFYNFHRISLVAPLANIIIEWAIQPIMVLGFITAVIGWVWLPFGILPAWFVWVPLTYLITAVKLLAKFPAASLEF